MNAWEVGTRIGPYVLVDRIGAGGMGDVWKARDERLDRLIAIKRLHVRPENLAAEARSIVALNHPRICALYDVGPDYMVIEVVDGQPLAGPVAPAEAVRLALQIASGLEAAHAKGIVHRDLKPATTVPARSGCWLACSVAAAMRHAPLRWRAKWRTSTSSVTASTSRCITSLAATPTRRSTR